MGVTFPLLNGHHIGFTSAQQREEDIIQRIAWYSGAVSIAADLKRQGEQGLISRLVAHHLRIDDEKRCEVEPASNWPRGSFNQCVPIRVHGASTGAGQASPRLLLRVPMAHRLVGMVDEKMRCEVATYIWMQENCPNIPIPRLFAFGFPDGSHVSSPLTFGLWQHIPCPFTRSNKRSVHTRKSSTVVSKVGEIFPKTNLRLAWSTDTVVLYQKPMGP
jgi:hypothetical protein